MRMPYRLTRMLIIAFLQNTLLSAMTVFVLRPTHTRRMDRALARQLRYLCRKRLGGKEGDRRLSVKEVFGFWKIADTETELTVRRIKTYQRWAKAPTNHVQELAAVFGHTISDRDHERERTQPDGSNGKHPTPWAKTFWSDIDKLGETEDGLAWRKDVGNDYRKVFCDQTAEIFCGIDPTRLRANPTRRDDEPEDS